MHSFTCEELEQAKQLELEEWRRATNAPSGIYQETSNLDEYLVTIAVKAYGREFRNGRAVLRFQDYSLLGNDYFLPPQSLAGRILR